MFKQAPLVFAPGLYRNRSKRASPQRWVDGDLVRFRDDVPAQVGGWQSVPVVGGPIAGVARGILGWRPNNQVGKFAAVGTFSNAYQFDGSSLSDITPSDMTAGRVDSIPGLGYGALLYGDDEWGTERPTSSLILNATTWSFDMFGETLLGCPTSDGKIREYTAGTDTELTTIANAPLARAICVSPERHVFAFGCDGNPRLVQWSDREDYDTWTPSGTNRAGGYEMQVTSPFQCGHRVRGLILGWTESEVVAFQPSYNALVYARETMDEAVGCAGPLAVCVTTESSGATAFWIGIDGFFMFDGIVRRLECEIYDYVYRDINLLQRAKFEAATNVEFNEVRFSYCSAGSNEIDRCVVLCLKNQSWSKMNLDRTAWLDRKIFPKPLAFASDGTIYEHETGETADGLEMPSFATSHPITIGVGDRQIYLNAFWPDLDENSLGANLTVIGRQYPGADDEVFGPYPFLRADEKIDLNIDVREFSFKISGNGGYWELGNPSMDVRSSGRRG